MEAMAEHDAKNDENATALFKQAFDQLMQAIASAPNETDRSAFMKQMEAHVTTTGISGSSVRTGQSPQGTGQCLFEPK
jgi:hypothetical protein